MLLYLGYELEDDVVESVISEGLVVIEVIGGYLVGDVDVV